MSGVEIDVKTRTESSKRDLAEINRSLAEMARSAKLSGAALGGMRSENLKSLSKDLSASTKSMVDFKSIGVGSMTAVDKSAAGAAATIDTVKRAVIGLGTAFVAFKGINAFNKVSDDLTLIQNKLQLVTNSYSELVDLQGKLKNTAKASRSALGSTADLFVTFSQSLEKAGKSQDNILSIVKTIQQAAALSGSSAESAGAAITQLSQGIASGVLRGEEFNSVMEQMKYLGIGLQRALGKSSGELRKMANDGALTTSALVDALDRMGKKTQQDFDKTAVTVAQASGMVSGSIAYLAGDFSKFFKLSSGFAGKLVNLSNQISSFGTDLIVNAAVVRQSVRNYIKELSSLDAFKLTAKSILTFEISPLDAAQRYHYLSKVKQYAGKLQSYLEAKDLKLQIGVSTEAGDNESFVKRIARDVGGARGAAATLKTTLIDLKDAAVVIADGVGLSFTNLARLLPRVFAPVKTYFTSFTESMSNTFATLSSSVLKSTLPTYRKLQGAFETVTLSIFSDTELERKWVNLFRVKNVKDFTGALKELNAARARIKVNDFGYVFNESVRSLQDMQRSVNVVLIRMGLMKNSFFEIKSFRFDRTINYFKDIGTVLKRLYDDLLGPALTPVFAKITNAAKAYAKTVKDAFNDTFNRSTGRKNGETFVKGFISGAKALFSFLTDLRDKFSGIGDAASGIAGGKGIIGGLLGALRGVGEYVSGFSASLFKELVGALSVANFKKILSAIGEAITAAFNFILAKVDIVVAAIKDRFSSFRLDYAFNFDRGVFDEMQYYIFNMYDRIADYTHKKLGKVEQRIRDFGTYVKDIFFEIYDAVVGHSYWPDMVDGVVDYTHNLFKSTSIIDRFGTGVKKTFQRIAESISSSKGAFAESFKQFMSTIMGLKFDDVMFALSKSLGSIIIGALAFVLGDARVKLSAVGFFFTIFNDAVKGAFTAFAPLLGGALGNSVSVYAQHLTRGILDAADSFFKLAPKFLAGFAEGLLPVTRQITDLIAEVPLLGSLIRNDLYSAIVVLFGAYAIFAKGGVATLTELFFGKGGTNGAKKEKEGIFDYLKAIRGFKAPGIDSEKLVSLMFPHKKIALAAALAFSTALSESISLVDASAIGLPLLGFAMLGKDGGARFAADTANWVVKLIKFIYARALATMTATFGAESLITKAFALPRTMFSKVADNAEPGLMDAGAKLLRSVKQMFVNLQANVADYAAGKGSFFDALFTETVEKTNAYGKKSKVKVRTSLGDAFATFADDIGNIKINDRSIRRYFERFQYTFIRNFRTLRDAIDVMPIANKIKGIATGLFAEVKAMSSGSFKLMQDGLSGLLAILKTKIGLFAVAAGILFATMANSHAASKDIEETSSAFEKLAKAILIAGGALATLGVGKRVFDTFKTGADTFKDGLIDPLLKQRNAIQDAADLAEFKKNLKSQIREKRKIFKESQKSAAEGLDSSVRDSYTKSSSAKARADARREYEDSLRGFAEARSRARSKEYADARGSDKSGATRAGFDAVKDKVLESYNKLSDKIKTAARSVFEYFKANTLIDMWANGATWISKFIKDSAIAKMATERLTAATVSLKAAFASFEFASIASGLANIAKSMWAVAAASAAIGKGAILSGVSGVFGWFSSLTSKGILSSLAGGFRGLAGGLMSALRALGPFILNALKFIKIPGLIGLGVSAVGALGLWLFGPNNNFTDNLEWAYNKVEAMLGMKPSTDSGKQMALSENLPRREIAGLTFDFSSELAKIDFGKLSDKQVEVLTELSQTTKTGLDDLENTFIRQGKVSDAQVAEARRKEEEMRGALLRQPSRKELSLKDSSAALIAQLEARDTSLWTLFKSAIGAKPYEPVAQAGSTDQRNMLEQAFDWLTDFQAIGDELNTAWSWVVDDLRDTASFFGLADEFDSLNESLGEFGNSVKEAVVAASDFVHDLPKLIDDAKDGAKIWWKEIQDKFGLGPLEDQKSRAAKLKGADNRYVQYEKSLPPEIATMVRTAEARYSKAEADYRDLATKGYRTSDGDKLKVEDYTPDKYIKMRKDAQAEAQAALANLIEVRNKASLVAYNEFRKQAIKDELQVTAASAKDLLKLDLGESGANFVGTKSDLNQIKMMSQWATIYKGNMENAVTLEDRVLAKLKEENIIRESNAFLEGVIAKTRDESMFEFSVKVTGIDVAVEDLRKLSFENADLANSFESNALKISELQAKINSNIRKDGSKDVLKSLYEQLGQAKVKAIEASVTSTDMEQINKRLQTFGLSAVSAVQFIGMSEDQVSKLAGGVDKLRVAQQELKNVVETKKPFEDQISALKEVRRLTQEAASALKQTTAKQLSNLKGSGAEKGIMAGIITGQEINPIIGQSKSRLSQFGKLTAAKANATAGKDTAQNLIENGPAAFKDMALQSYIAMSAAEVKIEKQMGKLTEVITTTLDNVFSSFSNFGLVLDNISFKGFDSKTRKEIAAIGSELAAIERAFSETPASAMSGAVFDKLIDRQQKAVEKARTIIEQQTRFSGKALGEALSSNGVESYQNLTAAGLKMIITLQKAAATVRIPAAVDTNDTASVEAFLKAMKDQEDRKKKLTRAVEDASATFATDLASFNEAVGASVNEAEFVKMFGGMSSGIGKVSREFKRSLQDAMQKGADPATLGTMFDRVKSLGSYVSFFVDFQNNMKNVVTEGFRAGYDRVKSILPNLSAKGFASFSPAARRGLAEQSALIDQYEKAMDMPLTSGLADILNKFNGSNIADVMAEFNQALKSQTGQTLEQLSATATQLNTDAVKENTAEIKALIAAAKGEAAPSAGVVNGIKGDTSVGNVSKEAFGALAALKEKSAADARSQLSNVRDRIAASSAGISQEAINLASTKQLAEMDRTTRLLDDALTALAKAPEDKIPTLQASIMNYKDALQDMESNIQEQAKFAKQAGKSFSESIVGGITGSFKDLLKGKVEEGKTAWTTFRDSILDSFTSTVVDTFAEGFINSFAGKGSPFAKMLGDTGSGISGLFGSLFGGGTGASTSDSAPDASEGILSSIMSLGSMLLTPLLSMLGIQTAGAATEAVKLTTDQLMLAAMTVELPAAIATSTAAIVSAIMTSAAASSGSGAASGVASLFAATGGFISGAGTGTSDSIPAMLSNGEYVINAKATKKFAPLLQAINTNTIPHFANGGMVPTGIIAAPEQVDMRKVKTSRNSSQQVINLSITGDISRQTKAEIYKMLPSIADGVNSHNREKGNR